MNGSALEKVVISQHEKVIRNQTLLILGTMENKGEDVVRVPQVEVDLFDKDGKFVDQCSEYIKGSLKPGESRNFKILCSDGKGHPPVEHASYKVRITGL